ncbi:MAG: alpha-amylase [Atopobiaceae bacterium]|nr:alpha-amylase [Atopobiaceae bacterium]
MSKSNDQLNGTMLQGFTWNLPPDGQHWRRLAQMADRLVNEGITSVWLPPAYKGVRGIEDVGYGVYDLWDLGEFDQRGSIPTKYGTRKDFSSLVIALQQAGIDVLADVVLNHKMGADASEEVSARRVATDNRLYDIGELEPIEAWTRFEFPGRAGELDDFVWDWECFKGVDYDAKSGENGIWLFEGKSWDSDVNQEMGNFDYLMGCDIDLHNEKVYKQLLKWGTWFVKESGVEGLRLDAVKHMSRDFYIRWLTDLRKLVKRDLFAVGEYWAFSADELSAYLGSECVMSLFDVPLHFAFYQASVDREHINFAHILDCAFVSRDPIHTVTFVDNHDTQPNQSLESTVQPWFKPVAYTIILLREGGYPCVFFADMYGLPSDAIPAVAELPLLMEIRRRYAYGAQHDYLNEADLAGWTREGSGDGDGLAVVLCNRAFPGDEQYEEPVAKEPHDAPNEGETADGAFEDDTPTDGGNVLNEPEEAQQQDRKPSAWPTMEMYVGSAHAGETWRCVMGDGSVVTIDDNGMGRFPASSSMMASIYLPEVAANGLNHIPIVMSR